MKESEIPQIENDDANLALAELKKKGFTKREKNPRNFFNRKRFSFKEKMYHILFRFHSHFSKIFQM
jgi:hypothetical protein